MTQQNAYSRFEAKEWNAAGATQFYGRERKRSYIVEVTLSEEIRGDLLQQAVDKALKRLPYYCSTFVRKRVCIIMPITICPSWWQKVKVPA